MKKWQVILLSIAGVAVLGVAGLYGHSKYEAYKLKKAMDAEYSSYIEQNKVFYPESYFNGTDISGKTVSEVINIFEDDFNSNKVTLISEMADEADVFSFSSLNVDFSNFENYVGEAYLGQAYSYEEYFGEKETEIKNYEYDIFEDIELERADFSSVSFLQAENITDSQDAYLDIDVNKGIVELVPEIYGNRLIDGVFEEKLETAVKTRNTEITFEADDFIRPEVLSDDEALSELKEAYEVAFNKTITLSVCGLELELSREDTRGFYDFSDGVMIDEGAVSDYVAMLKESYDTYGIPREFYTSTGETVTIETDTYGWLINAE